MESNTKKVPSEGTWLFPTYLIEVILRLVFDYENVWVIIRSLKEEMILLKRYLFTEKGLVVDNEWARLKTTKPTVQ